MHNDCNKHRNCKEKKKKKKCKQKKKLKCRKQRRREDQISKEEEEERLAHAAELRVTRMEICREDILSQYCRKSGRGSLQWRAGEIREVAEGVAQKAGEAHHEPKNMRKGHAMGKTGGELEPLPVEEGTAQGEEGLTRYRAHPNAS